jgi:hypothetical protein
MKPEKKRKTDAAQNEQTKRHRAGSNASANPPPAENLSPKAPPAISFGVNPSPQAETLATDFHGLPFHSWVNPRTVVLFAQVDVSSFSKNLLTRLEIRRVYGSCLCVLALLFRQSTRMFRQIPLRFVCSVDFYDL